MSMNYYYVAMPLFLLAMYFLGTRDYKVTKKGVRTFRPRFYKIFAVIFAAITGLMILFESSDGIIQMFDDMLLYDESDKAWSVISAVAAIEFIAIAFYGMCLISANLGRKVRRNVIAITTEEE